MPQLSSRPRATWSLNALTRVTLSRLASRLRATSGPKPATRHPAGRAPRRPRLIVAVAAVTLLALSACSGGGASDAVAGSGGSAAAPTSAGGAALNIYAFSVAKPAIDALGAGYASSPTGAGATIQASYGPSGDQSRKVAAGAPADVVAFSLAPDVTRLVSAGLVASDWTNSDHHGTPFGSVVVLVVRKGNPKALKDWPDLLRDGVSVVTPNPLSSGSAQWNLLAPYAAQSEGGKNPAAGLDYVSKLIAGHLHSQPASGAEAAESFRQGTGDVLLSYENEAIALTKANPELEYLVPPTTFKIENAVAALATSRHPDAAKAFVAYVNSPAGQEAVAKAGYRPADASVLAAHPEFTSPAKLWTIADLGGWPSVTASLFDKSTGAITTLYAKGGS